MDIISRAIIDLKTMVKGYPTQIEKLPQGHPARASLERQLTDVSGQMHGLEVAKKIMLGQYDELIEETK